MYSEGFRRISLRLSKQCKEATVKFDLHRLQLLRELSHRGTLAAVAAAMSYSSSAVSQQLSVLEQEVGTPLLEPDGRRVRLTAQAEILVRHATVVFEQLERARAEIAESLESVVGTVRLACIQTAALTLIPAVLARLADTHPGLRVEVTQAEPDVALPALLAREFDLVIDEVYADFPVRRSQELHSETVGEDPIRVAFASPPGTRSADEVGLSDFADHPWVLEPEKSPGREWAVATCRKAGFEPYVPHQTSDVLVQAGLVARGHAVAFLPDLMWRTSLPSFHLRRVSGAHTRQVVTTCRTGSGGHPTIVTLRQALRTEYQQRTNPAPDR
jgi:DNA-binding transcriptional LysR family regulator